MTDIASSQVNDSQCESIAIPPVKSAYSVNITKVVNRRRWIQVGAALASVYVATSVFYALLFALAKLIQLMPELRHEFTPSYNVQVLFPYACISFFMILTYKVHSFLIEEERRTWIASCTISLLLLISLLSIAPFFIIDLLFFYPVFHAGFIVLQPSTETRTIKLSNKSGLFNFSAYNKATIVLSLIFSVLIFVYITLVAVLLVGGYLGDSGINLFIWAFLLLYPAYRYFRRWLVSSAEKAKKNNHKKEVLFLRSFGDDELVIPTNSNYHKNRFEEVIALCMWNYGPVVAIGNPNENLPLLGAAREYVSNTQWKNKVELYMEGASRIILVLGHSEGLAWELSTVARLGLQQKLFILIPPVSETSILSRWHAMSGVIGCHSDFLPSDANIKDGLVIYFDHDGNPVVITSNKRGKPYYEAALEVAYSKSGECLY